MIPIFGEEPAERAQISGALSAMTLLTMVLFAGMYLLTQLPQYPISYKEVFLMADIFTESIVARRPLPGGSALQTVSAVTAVVFLLAGLSLHPLLLVLAAAAGIGWYWLRQNTDVELEYTHTNGELDIDKVMNNSRRKHLLTVELGRVDIIAPVDSPSLTRFRDIKILDYSARDPDRPPYAMVCQGRDGKQLLLLQLDEKMLAGLKRWLPGKVET